MDLRDICIDELRAGGAGCGEAFVPVENEVIVVELEEFDRRNGSIWEGVMNRTDGVTQMRSLGVEATVEVAAATNRACDGVDRNLAQPDSCVSGKVAAAAKLVELGEISASALPDHASVAPLSWDRCRS